MSRVALCSEVYALCWAFEALCHARGDYNDASIVKSLLLDLEGNAGGPTDSQTSDILQDSKFWCELVTNSCVAGPCSGASGEDLRVQRYVGRGDIRETVLDKLCDLSPDHVEDVFNQLCPSGGGLTSVKQLGTALRNWVTDLDDKIPELIFMAMSDV